jgi:hypothetical protein
VKIQSPFQLKFLDEKFFFKYLLDSKKIPGDRKEWGSIPISFIRFSPRKLRPEATGLNLSTEWKNFGLRPEKEKFS